MQIVAIVFFSAIADFGVFIKLVSVQFAGMSAFYSDEPSPSPPLKQSAMNLHCLKTAYWSVSKKSTST